MNLDKILSKKYFYRKLNYSISSILIIFIDKSRENNFKNKPCKFLYSNFKISKDNYQELYYQLCLDFHLDQSTMIYSFILIDRYLKHTNVKLSFENLLFLTVISITLSIKWISDKHTYFYKTLIKNNIFIDNLFEIY